MIDWFKRNILREDTRHVYDVRGEEFHELAFQRTGVQWDFSRLDGTFMCCVDGCPFTRLWGYWTCDKHKQLELDNFDPVDEYGNLFYSHKWKKDTCD